MDSTFAGPVNIGSDEMVSINQLVTMTAEIAAKEIRVKHVPGPLGVRGRNSDNRLIREKLGWSPSGKLLFGLRRTYAWIHHQVCTGGKFENRMVEGIPTAHMLS
jgi:nucleoside-diphosphate-sugar epimerase